ncbi:sensor histidine kinase KdpD [Prosthecomicrobium hirschii]|uniref:sensor histidine kinase n=1 Tax=Prosthecodimorpha hirschii TaxID=665126 RepID=UPI001128BA16|nr:sensor histidine kinase KdpD [Prosthecomicrobium hirschii]TPQ49989.1 sensor histidine kinase KdpD [Prosthecomicrobium hirschii]
MGEANPDRRPSPDALLALADSERRGRLKVWLGAAPGVGKTYAMLSAARQARQAGTDVVVGLAETHGRADTEALTVGLETLPRRPFSHRGHLLAEFDIDGALARHPAVLVVDELAHSNAPGSRHPKRYQDIDELLRAGIDVWTALNIQHLESLSDVVTRITGVTVRETVPDTVLDRADEVVLVDITPSELIQRLKDGKVYRADNARRAIDHYFTPGNLTALRELALRRTAARVDDQMVDYLRQNAIEGPWPTAERILVCVGGDARSMTAIRAASRFASGLNADWLAVHVERPEAAPEAGASERIEETLRLAERLGATVLRPSGRDIVTEILRVARAENATQIFLGRSRGGVWRRLRGRSLTAAVLERAGALSVHVVGEDDGEGPAPAGMPRLRLPALSLSGAGAAVLAVAAALGIGSGLVRYVELPNLSMIFLAAVVLCALRFGTWSAVLASALSFAAYNFFFIEPVYTFTVAKPHELLALVVFLLVAIAIGGLAGRLRDQSELVRSRAGAIRSQYEFARKLSGTAKLDDLLWAVASQIAAAVGGRCLVLLAEGQELVLRGAAPPDDEMGPAEWTAAYWAMTHHEPAGWRTGTLPNARLQFRPLRTARGTTGTIGFEPADPARALTGERERMVDALIDQASVAVERIRLVDDMSRAAASAESEKLRSALLTSLSHDLKTPLAAILGAITSVRALGARMDDAARSDLLLTIEEETRRLARFVSNLLDMTKLEAGGLDITPDEVDLAEVLPGLIARAALLLPGLTVKTRPWPPSATVRGNPILVDQVLFNILENADKYAGPNAVASVGLEVADGRVRLVVEDQGPGIPADQLDRVFAKFHRVATGDGRAAGTGLGLAIAKGIVEAMGGTIRAESPIAGTRGTRILITWPLSAPNTRAGGPPEGIPS